MEMLIFYLVKKSFKTYTMTARMNIILFLQLKIAEFVEQRFYRRFFFLR